MVNFNNATTGVVDSYLWTFEGGVPATSTDENPQVVYENPGIYDVKLEAFGPGGSDSTIIENMVVATFPAVANFDYMITDAIVVFENLSMNATSYLWDFGDGSPITTSEDPIHVYDTAGVYVVTLTAFSEYCDSIITQTLLLDFTGVENLEELGIKIFPNPASDWLTIQNNNNEWTQMKVFGIDGKEIPTLQRVFSQNIQLDIQELPAGIYFLNLFQGEKMARFRLVKI